MGKMKKYDSYKDSGIDWIGEIPSHWNVNKFGRSMFFQEGPGLRNWQFKDHGIKVICVTNIVPPNIDFSKMTKYISIEEYESTYKHFTVNKGDLMLASSGASWGKVAEYIQDEKVILNTSTIRINEGENNRVKKEFIKWIIQSPYVYESLNLLLTGSCQPNFGPTHLNKLTCIYPTSIDEQTAIANYLDQKTAQIDDLIAKKERLIQLLEEERTAIINQAVTKGLDPTVPMKDSGIEWLGEIPEHWEVKRVGSLSNCITGYAFKSEHFSFEEGIRIVRGDNVTENSLRWGDKTRYWNQYSNILDRFQLQKNDIVIGMDGSKVGKNYALVDDSELPLLLVQRVARVRSFSELSAKWIHYNIGTYNFRYYINLSKTDPAIPHITLKNITDYPICMPNMEEVISILNFLNKKLDELDSILINSIREIELLKEYKTALISEVVTGKVDVRNEKW